MTIPSIIASEMAAYEAFMAQQLHTEVRLINDIAAQLNQRHGKRLRPMLTLLSAGAALGHVPEQKVHLAVAMELLHNSSLIHDDVVDEASLRRGLPTVNSTWGNKIAVLFGDFYLANVMNLLCRHASKEEMEIVNRTAVEMSEGELLQQQNSLGLDTSIDAYRQTIYKKTASLMAACCQVGGGYTQFGTHFGMAFQMRDDLLDYSPAAATGKPYGNDLRERKMTLPIIHFLQQASEGDRTFAMGLLQKDEVEEVEILQLIAAMERQGSLEATRKAIAEEVSLALEALEAVEESPYKEALVQLTQQLLH